MKLLRSFFRARLPGMAMLCATALLGVVFSSAAQSQQKISQKPNVYQLEMELSRSGNVIARPKMTVLFGKPARMTIIEKDGQDGSLRIQVTAMPADRTAAGIATVNLQAQVLEEMAGAWVVVGEPAVRAAEGQGASLQVQGGIGALQITIKATPMFNQKAVGGVVKQCGALDAPLVRQIAGGPGDPNCPSLPCPGGCMDCCSVPCSDGSGRDLTCCGAIECCEGICGACCSPPGGGLGC